MGIPLWVWSINNSKKCVKGNSWLPNCNILGIPKIGKVIPENDKLTAANPDPKVRASLKLLLIDTNSIAKAWDASINSNKESKTPALLPFNGKSPKTNIVKYKISPTSRNHSVYGVIFPNIIVVTLPFPTAYNFSPLLNFKSLPKQ